MKYCYLDAEYNSSSNQYLNLICIATRCYDGEILIFQREFWLFNGSGQTKAAQKFFLDRIHEGYIFVCFNAEAETRTLMSLLRPPNRAWLEKLKLIDLQLEYKLLLNENEFYSYGPQLIRGEIITTSPKRNSWGGIEEVDDENFEPAHSKPEKSLAAACFKLLGVRVDLQVKEDMRAICIRNNPEEILSNLHNIQRYCLSDIDYLPALLSRLIQLLTTDGEFTFDEWLSSALSRGDYGKASSKMVEKGYAINQRMIDSIISNAPAVLNAAAKDCVDADTSIISYTWNPKKKTYKQNQSAIQKWIKSLPESKTWPKTATGKFSTKRDDISEYFDTESPGFPGAFCRLLKIKQSLNGFLPGSKKLFKDCVGSDGRARAHFNIYGSKTSRSQPSASTYIPLKAKWMSIFIHPPKGKWNVAYDWSSVEFLAAAILSQDTAMMEAYASGDVYIAFAIAAGIAPPGATKKTHRVERNVCKATVLGISYDMGSKRLAEKITKDSGQPTTQKRAEQLIAKFYNTYNKYYKWKEKIKSQYQSKGFLRLLDGWTMWGSNENIRSVGNFPVQGNSAVAMREAVKLCQRRGLDVIITLHDSLTCEISAGDTDAILLLRSCMIEAFEQVFKAFGVTQPIQVEGEVWGEGAGSSGIEIPNTVFMDEYVNDKGRADLEKYRGFIT